MEPGREQEVLRWLGPLTDGATLVQGWRVGDVQIAATEIRLGLRADATGAPLWLPLVCQPPHIIPRVPDSLPRDVAALVRTHAAKLAFPGPFVRVSAPTAPAMPQPVVPWNALGWAYTTLRFVAVLTLLLGLRLAWQVTSRRERWALLGVTTLGVLVRGWLAPANFLHEYYHVDEALSALGGQPGFFNGYGGPALYTAVQRLLGPGAPVDGTGIFAVSALASTLSVAAAAGVASRVWLDWRAGLFAGLLLALSPVHVRWGAAEDQWILATAWTLLALWAWLRARDEGEGLAAVVAVGATVLAMQTRPELVILPIIVAALLAVRWDHWRVPRAGGAWALPLLGLAALWPLALLWTTRPAAPPLHLDVLPLTLGASLWLDPTWTSLPVCATGLGAVVVLAVRRQRDAGVILLTALAMTSLPLLFFGSSGPFMQRTQLLALALGLVLTAGVWAAFMDLLSAHVIPVRVTRWMLPAVLLATLGAGLWDRRTDVSATFAQQAEWTFLRDTLPRLPPFARLLAPGPQSLDRFVVSTWPRQPTQWVDPTEAWRTQTWPEPGADLLYYQGMHCWFADPHTAAIPGQMRPACAAVTERYVLEPLAETVLEPPGDAPLSHALPGRFPVGLYRAVGLRSTGGAR